jgi:hypothetical protein
MKRARLCCCVVIYYYYYYYYYLAYDLGWLIKIN